MVELAATPMAVEPAVAAVVGTVVLPVYWIAQMEPANVVLLVVRVELTLSLMVLLLQPIITSLLAVLDLLPMYSITAQ
jgi:hypothetical protein